jgi:hypothetical protein
MTRKAMKKRKYKAEWWNRFRKLNSYNDYIEYKRANKDATSEFKRAKKSFERKLAKNIKKDPNSFLCLC